MSWSTGEVDAARNWFKPSSKIFYWPFQGGILLWFIYVISVLFLLYFRARLFIDALWSPAGKGLTSWFSFVMIIVTLSHSHWYLGSGLVLDCIDSWSLPSFFLMKPIQIILCNWLNKLIQYRQVTVHVDTTSNKLGLDWQTLPVQTNLTITGQTCPRQAKLS